jgi:transcriptional regulator with XRE-family HTH domain
MKQPPAPEEQEYSPARLLDVLVARLRLKNDAALSRLLGVEAPTISKIRHKRLRVGAAMLLRMHEVTHLSIDELRALMGDRRARMRLPGEQQQRH